MASAPEELKRLDAELSKLESKLEAALSSVGQALDVGGVTECGEAGVDALLAELADIRDGCQRVTDNRRQLDGLLDEKSGIERELPAKREELLELRRAIEAAYLPIGEAAAALIEALDPVKRQAFDEYYQPLIAFEKERKKKAEEEKKKGFFKKLVGGSRRPSDDEEDRRKALQEIGKLVFVAPDFLAIAEDDRALSEALAVPEQALMKMEPLEVGIPKLEARLEVLQGEIATLRGQEDGSVGTQSRRTDLWVEIGRAVVRGNLLHRFPDIRLDSLAAHAREAKGELDAARKKRRQTEALAKLEEIVARREAIEQERVRTREKIAKLENDLLEQVQEEDRLQGEALDLLSKHGRAVLTKNFASWGSGEPPIDQAIRAAALPSKESTPRPKRPGVPPPLPPALPTGQAPRDTTWRKDGPPPPRSVTQRRTPLRPGSGRVGGARPRPPSGRMPPAANSGPRMPTPTGRPSPRDPTSGPPTPPLPPAPPHPPEVPRTEPGVEPTVIIRDTEHEPTVVIRDAEREPTVVIRDAEREPTVVIRDAEFEPTVLIRPTPGGAAGLPRVPPAPDSSVGRFTPPRPAGRRPTPDKPLARPTDTPLGSAPGRGALPPPKRPTPSQPTPRPGRPPELPTSARPTPGKPTPRPTKGELRPAVFLDRDGTIIEDVHFLRHIEDVAFLPGAIEALRQLLHHQYRLVVVTNQSGIARGYFGPEDVENVHRFMAQSLAKQGVRVAGWYFCPHHPEGVISKFKVDCACRKPKPRLITHAAKVHNVDLARSWMIGDKWSDVQAGVNAGVRGVLVRTGKGRDEEKSGSGPAAFVADSLAAAVSRILSAEPALS